MRGKVMKRENTMKKTRTSSPLYLPVLILLNIFTGASLELKVLS
jgi:hypothetical protein